MKVRLQRLEQGPDSIGEMRTQNVEGELEVLAPLGSNMEIVCDVDALVALAPKMSLLVTGPGLEFGVRQVTTSPIRFIEDRSERRCVFETTSGSRWMVERVE